jgi:8-oxo-dGTP diphosphatase
MENSTMIDKLAWIHLVDKRILCVRSKNKTLYYIPGGKREAGETDLQALIREIQEELSVDLLAETLQFAGEFIAQADCKEAGINVKIRAYTAEYQGNLAPAAEIAEMVWLTYADRGKCSLVVQKIFDGLLQHGLIAH